MRIKDEEIIRIIKKKNPKIQFISSEIIIKKNKHRKFVHMKCECGQNFSMVLDKITSNKYLLCNKCSKEKQSKTRKKHYNKKYLPQITENGFTLVNPKSDLYANRFVEVIENDTGYRGFIYPNRTYKKMLIFSLEHNKSNYIYNVNQYAKNIGIKSRAIEFSDNNKWVSQGMKFICECGKEFETTVRAFQKGKFHCDCCSKRYSQNEIMVSKFLDLHNIKYIQEFSINSLKDVLPSYFDFYLTEYNILIEVDGQHHEQMVNLGGNLSKEDIEKRFKTYKKQDEMKDDYCLRYNIPLLRINYKDMKNGKYLNIILTFIQTVKE